jgi:hypothetical protein
MEKETFKVTIKIRYEVKKTDIPDHSVIVLKEDFGNSEIHYGPIPDVLIGEVLREIKESRKKMLEDCVKRLKGEGGLEAY